MGKASKRPKKKCCVSKVRCDRCPIRMLKEGSLPAGYGVHKRELVRLGPDGRPASKKIRQKAGKRSGFKAGKKIKGMRKQKKSARE